PVKTCRHTRCRPGSGLSCYRCPVLEAGRWSRAGSHARTGGSPGAAGGHERMPGTGPSSLLQSAPCFPKKCNQGKP
ncbi:MAG TPA: hypothetical protein VLL74_04080, partial [Methanoregula sp.]|nr:hypothetical protein [Methanoregula sp.]